MEATVYRDIGLHEDRHWWFTARRAIVRDFLNSVLPANPSRRVLDVGTGCGGMLPVLAEFGSVTGMDANDEALASASTRARGARLLKGQLPEGLPPGERFDLITSFDVIEHIPEVVDALMNMRQALAPGGRLVVTVPAFPFLWSEYDVMAHHQRRYTEASLRAHLEAAGFVMGRHSYFNTWLFPVVAAVRMGQKLFRLGARGEDLVPPAPLLNTVLDSIFSSERFIVRKAKLPFGVSLIAEARAAAA